MTFTVQPKRRHPIQLILVWFVLNLLINIDYPASAAPLSALPLPSLEVWGMLLILSLSAGSKFARSPWAWAPLVPLFLFLRLFRCGEVLVPHYLQRPFNLYLDIGYLPDLIHLLYHTFAWPRLLFCVLSAVVLLSALLWFLCSAFRTCLRIFAERAVHRRIVWGLTAFLLLLIAIYPQGRTGFPGSLPLTTITPRIVTEVAFVRKISALRREWQAAVETAAARIPPLSTPLTGLHQSDVYLIFIESYGETLFGNAGYTHEFVPVAHAFETALRQAGYNICSRYLESPTFGGLSWLAFGTLESGVWLPDQLHFDLLLKSTVPPLAAYFNRAGYRTVSVLPGTTRPWPEGTYFDYTRTYAAVDLDYQGPPFDWSPMPDQYVLQVVHQQEIAVRRRPLFIRYMLTSTHASFKRQPAYLDDWSAIDRGRIYHDLPAINFNVNWPDLTKAGPAYLAAIRYDFTVLQAYFTRFIQDGALIILLGDHQPNAQITGPGASFLVPVHVISRNGALLEPFGRMGYSPGFVPHHAPPEKGMHDFLSDFLAAFSRPPAQG